MDSRQLIADYVKNGSEAAFRELVTRYLDLVYSAALRLVEGDSHRAEDVAQTVFIDLARKAGSLSRETMLGGWLHRHTCFVACHVMRGERRRQQRERQAVEMNTLHNNPDPHAALIAPILDEAINQLGEEDRKAILLRFFEQRDFRSVGEALGSNENAARMRVNRALEKLSVLLKEPGVKTSAAGLAGLLAATAVHSAPVGLAVTISAAAAFGTATSGATTATIKAIAMTTFQKSIIGAALAAAVGIGIYQARQTSALRAQLAALQQRQAGMTDDVARLRRERDDAARRLAIRSSAQASPLPAPAVNIISNAPVAGTQTNLYGRFMDKWPKLTAAQVADYLKANRTNAASLLAAYRTSGDSTLLKQAMEKFPNDPQVAFEAALDKSLSPDEQRRWLNAFEQSAPDNALANYLSAFNYFNSGQKDQAIQELASASGKQIDDYTPARVQDDQEAYASAGYSAPEAETIAFQSLTIPQDSEIKQAGKDLISMADAYNQSGDHDSAQATLQMAMNLGVNMASQSSSSAIINQLVGLAIQSMALNAMDPSSPYGDNGQTVQDEINQISQYRQDVRQLGQQAEPLMQGLSDQDMATYESRRMMFGEVPAMQWVVSKYGPPQ